MGKISNAENFLCGLVIFVLIAGVIGSVIMVILLAMWEKPPSPAWMVTNQGEVYYGVEVFYNGTVWQDDLYQTTSDTFKTASKDYCNDFATIIGASPYIGRQYRSCTVISFREGPSYAPVVTQYRLTLLSNAVTSSFTCGAANILEALTNVTYRQVPITKSFVLTGTRIFNIPLPPTYANTCQQTNSCGKEGICLVSAVSPSGSPVCANNTVKNVCQQS